MLSELFSFPKWSHLLKNFATEGLFFNLSIVFEVFMILIPISFLRLSYTWQLESAVTKGIIQNAIVIKFGHVEFGFVFFWQITHIQKLRL